MGRSLELASQRVHSIGELQTAVTPVSKNKLDGYGGSGGTEGHHMKKWPNGWGSQKIGESARGKPH